MKTILLQYLTLSLYAFFAGFTFCYGFGMRTSRKLIFFVTFAAIAIFVFKTKGEFVLHLILPIPTLVAIGLCRLEKKSNEITKRRKQ